MYLGPELSSKKARMNNVVYHLFNPKADIPPDRILEKAIGELETVIVLGMRKDGSEYFASSVGHSGTMMFLVERFKKDLLENSEVL